MWFKLSTGLFCLFSMLSALCSMLSRAPAGDCCFWPPKELLRAQIGILDKLNYVFNYLTWPDHGRSRVVRFGFLFGHYIRAILDTDFFKTTISWLDINCIMKDTDTIGPIRNMTVGLLQFGTLFVTLVAWFKRHRVTGGEYIFDTIPKTTSVLNQPVVGCPPIHRWGQPWRIKGLVAPLWGIC